VALIFNNLVEISLYPCRCFVFSYLIIGVISLVEKVLKPNTRRDEHNFVSHNTEK